MKLLVLMFALLALPAASPAFSQAPAGRTMRLVVPFPPGGAPDVLARMVAARLSESGGVASIVDNRPGANGVIAAEHVMKSPPDGQTLFMADTGHYGINPALRVNLPYSPLKDFAPVIEATKSQLYISVGNASPANTLQELVALSKSKPGGLTYGSSGSGSVAHLAMELLRLESGGNFVHVPYKGVAQVVPALLSGEVDVSVGGAGTLLPHQKAGKLRMLAAVNPDRWITMPQLPTAAEAGFPGVKMDISIGLLAPAGTPPEVINRLNPAVAAALRVPEMSEKLSSLGMDVIAGTPAQFADSIRRQMDAYARLVKASGAKVD